jgi:hypothetical protein
VLENWKRARRAERVKPGDGRPLQRFRWWQSLTRGLFYLQLAGDGERPVIYAVDIPRKSDPGYDDSKRMAHLYLNGRHHAESKVPAAFPVQGGIIEVAIGRYGVRRAHYVTADGEEQLVPDPDSAEGRRARLDREHPGLSRSLGVVSVVFLIVGVVLLVLQVAEPISAIPAIAENIGTFVSPIHLPIWLNILLGLAALAASTERALRLSNSWLDSAGN